MLTRSSLFTKGLLPNISFSNLFLSRSHIFIYEIKEVSTLFACFNVEQIFGNSQVLKFKFRSNLLN